MSSARARIRGRSLPRRVEVDARAKLNLGIAVGPKRDDGFHEIATVFQSISLADTLVAERRRTGFTLRVRHENAALRGCAPSGTRFVPAGRTNIVLHAARLFAKRFGMDGGARFTLIKRIPSRAGLGGGSADAAATLRALSQLHGVATTRRALMPLALELGSDVPFALTGGTAAGFGRGEILRPLRLSKPFRAILAVPRWRVSTARAYAALDRNKYGLTLWGSKLRFVQALSLKRLSPARALRLGNSFEDVLGDNRASLDALFDRLSAAGAMTPHMTGSGSAVFGILPPGVMGSTVIGRISGIEPLYLVRSTGRGLHSKSR